MAITNSFTGADSGPFRQNRFLIILTRQDIAPVIPPRMMFAVPIKPNIAHCVRRMDFLVLMKPMATMSAAPVKEIIFPIMIIFIAILQNKKCLADPVPSKYMIAMTPNVHVSLVAIYGRLWIARPITSINDKGKYTHFDYACQAEIIRERKITHSTPRHLLCIDYAIIK